jgi:squalene-hopene/tetraprenyl-beta-curcumene cyclase
MVIRTIGFIAIFLAGTTMRAAAPGGGAGPIAPPDSGAAAKGQAAVDKALAYLKSQQKPDGSWQSSPQEPPAFTALVVRCFLSEQGYDAATPFLNSALAKLLSYQGPDGRISAQTLDNYNTAIAVSALSVAKGAEYEAAVGKAVGFLKSIQWNDRIQGVENQNRRVDQSNPNYGGWGYGRSGRADMSNVQITLEALHDAGLKPDDPAFQAALTFVSRDQNRSESNDQPWAGNDGGFVYSPADNGQSFAGGYTTPDGQQRLRSYGSMTYAGLKSMIYAGLTHDDPRVKAAWDWISHNWTLDENPGLREGNPDSAKQGMYYYYMTLGRALEAYGQPTITDAQGAQHDWRVELIDKLTAAQKPDGSWQGERRWMEDNPVLVTSYGLIALQAAERDLKAHPAR